MLNDYIWKHLTWHLRQAGCNGDADALLTDYYWIKGKLASTGIQSLFSEYHSELKNPAAKLIGNALGLSLDILSRNPDELPHQLWGRLANTSDNPIFQELLKNAREEQESCGFQLKWPSLMSPVGQEILRLESHGLHLGRATYSPDGATIIATASENASVWDTVYIWDVNNGKELLRLEHKGRLSEIVYNPDCSRILTISDKYEFLMRIWDAKNGKELFKVDVPNEIHTAKFSRDGTRIVTISWNKNKAAQVWDAANLKKITSITTNIPGGREFMNDADFSPDSKFIVTASYWTCIWNSKSGKKINQLWGHDAEVNTAMYSFGGSRIVTASNDYTAKVWDAITGKVLLTLTGHTSFVYSAKFSFDDNFIMTTSADHTARIWDANNGNELFSSGDYTKLMNSSESSYRIISFWDEAVRIWEKNNKSEKSGNSGFLSSKFSPDGNNVISNNGATVSIWSADKVNNAVYGDEVLHICFSPNGKNVMVILKNNKNPHIIDVDTGKVMFILKGHDHFVIKGMYSPNGKHIVTASLDKTACIWDAKSGKRIFVLHGHTHTVNSAIYSPDGNYIVTSSYDKTARIWNARNGNELIRISGHNDSVVSAVYSPDGRKIVTTSTDNTIGIWNSKNGKLLLRLESKKKDELRIKSAIFSPDGGRILIYTDNYALYIWDEKQGKIVSCISGHDNGILSFMFNAEGTHIITTSYHNPARIWDASSGEEVKCFSGHDNADSTAALISSDEKSVFTICSDCSMRFWDMKNGIELARLSFDYGLKALAVKGDIIAIGDDIGKVHFVEILDKLKRNDLYNKTSTINDSIKKSKVFLRRIGM